MLFLCYTTYWVLVVHTITLTKCSKTYSYVADCSFFRSSHYYWLVVQTPLLSHWDFIVVVFQVNTKNSYCIAALCCNKKTVLHAR